MKFFKIKITPVEDLNKADEVEIEFDTSILQNFIKERDTILNDIIYSDKVKFARTKQNYNKSFNNVINLIKQAGILKVTRCEIIAMEGRKELEQQQIKFDEQRKQLEQKIELLMKRISDLEEKQL